jgi:hypothetical protein
MLTLARGGAGVRDAEPANPARVGTGLREPAAKPDTGLPVTGSAVPPLPLRLCRKPC